MLIEGKVFSSTGSGAYVQPQFQGDSTVSVGDVNPRFAALGNRGLLYGVSTAGAGVALAAGNLFSTGITSIIPILGLVNPASSKVNLFIIQAFLQITAAPNSAAVTGGFMLQTSPALVPSGAASGSGTNLLTQRAQSVGQVYNNVLFGASTTGTLTAIRQLPSGTLVVAQGATGTPFSSSPTIDNIDGAIVLPPGTALSLNNGISNTTCTVIASLMWAELPATITL